MLLGFLKSAYPFLHKCVLSVLVSLFVPSDETLNRGPLALLLRRQYEIPFGINIGLMQFSIFQFRTF